MVCNYKIIFSKRVCTGKCRLALGIVNYRIIFLLYMLLLIHGDVEPKPGCKRKLSIFFAFCHWNVSSIFTHNKLTLLTTYNVIHKYDVIWTLETYLDSTFNNSLGTSVFQNSLLKKIKINKSRIYNIISKPRCLRCISKCRKHLQQLQKMWHMPIWKKSLVKRQVPSKFVKPI